MWAVGLWPGCSAVHVLVAGQREHAGDYGREGPGWAGLCPVHKMNPMCIQN